MTSSEHRNPADTEPRFVVVVRQSDIDHAAGIGVDRVPVLAYGQSGPKMNLPPLDGEDAQRPDRQQEQSAHDGRPGARPGNG